MLKLKKIQILGFKSFCDKTELTLPGEGIAVVVGPNGCGKSNILDGITWVLGEQSAKSLRGGKMEDVIFAGTRDRRALGMAEVSITLIDPEAYGAGPLTQGATLESQTDEDADPDWDEATLRAGKTAEVEELIAAAQPNPTRPSGQDLDQTSEPGSEAANESSGEPDPDGAEEATAQTTEAADEVILKIRRRKFQRVAQQGEVVVTRRLFRTGDSEYLLNGKLCRLADIRDIFMGTGLGPESYAIIGQERIGQLLSSKPHDRRAIIEEAAGITRFKTKKRLAELRLEQTRQNLARIDDIFDEVARQLVTLKRQAAKAERYGLLRDELQAKLRVVLAGRLSTMEAEAEALAASIAGLTEAIDGQAAEIEQLQAELAAGQQRGYALDAEAKQQGRLASESAVELERARTRQAGNAERLAELEQRHKTLAAEQAQTREQLAALGTERAQQKAFLETAAGETEAMRADSAARQARAREAAAAIGQAEGRVEAARREAAQLLQQLNQLRREQAQAEESLASADRDSSRLAAQVESARGDLAALGAERGQVSLRFETAAETLQRLEGELAGLRAEQTQTRAQEGESRRRGDGLRSERATLAGRRDSLQGLLREHSYSTDTVKKLFRAQTLTGGLKPVGTLADFLEVGRQYESVVDEFLRDELNYIVVKSWDAAEEGMRLLRGSAREGGVDGRATFLVHPEDAQARFSFEVAEQAGLPATQGVVQLKDCIRVLDGFGKSLEVILPKLRDGYVTEDAGTARMLALENPDAFFLAPGGECFHNVTVTGGKPSAAGPLALKRELRDAEAKLATLEAELAQTELQTATLARAAVELGRRMDGLTEQRRVAEREAAHESAALRQLDGEKQRLERRVHDYALEGERARVQRDERAGLIARKAEAGANLERQHAAVEARQEQLQQAVAEARAVRDQAQAQAAELLATLAGLEERRRGAEANYARTDRLFQEAERRGALLGQQLASAAAETETRRSENAGLAAREAGLQQTRVAAEASGRALQQEAALLRTSLGEAEARLRLLRGEVEAAREQRGGLLTVEARLRSELEHLAAASLEDLGLDVAALRALAQAEDFALLAPAALAEEAEACRAMKRRLEAMGPVNMMALEEYRETEERHTFLETQRRDLLDSIENTRSTIRELDGISRLKFDEAFVRINENFRVVFARLFGGGHASMRLTDEEHSEDSGIDIVAQPPGKKLQNIFLLSGGEKALTALSLLMGIFQFQPAPFCVLDEVDAPLDETNVGRLAEMLRSMATDTQFVMVTHSKRMMSGADMIYGVTMQEPGVSKLVSVRLQGASAGAGGALVKARVGGQHAGAAGGVSRGERELASV